MTAAEHELMRAQLPLAAAGALDERDASVVLAHTAACESCRRELEVWGSYANGLRQLPQPVIPADLVRRTQMRILQSCEGAQERREYAVMLSAFVLFSWATSFAVWFVARSMVGVSLEVYGINLVGAVPWMLLSSVVTWVTAGSAAMVFANHRQTGRFQ